MISINELVNYDDTPLMFEETAEKFYLDKSAKIGRLLPEEKWHDTDLDKIIPEDFLYDVGDSLLDSEDCTSFCVKDSTTINISSMTILKKSTLIQ